MFGPMMGAAKGLGKAMTGAPGMGGGNASPSGSDLFKTLMSRVGGDDGARKQMLSQSPFAGGNPAPAPQKQMPNLGSAMGGAMGGMFGGSRGQSMPSPGGGMMAGAGSGIGALLGRMGMGGAKPPMMPPPNVPNRVPPAWQRYQTGQKMIQGYQNGWNPNPVLTGLMG